jgi:hypothetical protein
LPYGYFGQDADLNIRQTAGAVPMQIAEYIYDKIKNKF